ncbi:MAG TPA: hypothetical protein VFK88_12140 [Gallionella sp.]|nr:hypothetical protein [Gallionella sp.]
MVARIEPLSNPNEIELLPEGCSLPVAVRPLPDWHTLFAVSVKALHSTPRATGNMEQPPVLPGLTFPGLVERK